MMQLWPGVKREQVPARRPVETGLGNTEVIIPVVEPPKFTDFAEVMPVYEGGLSAMINSLQRICGIHQVQE